MIIDFLVEIFAENKTKDAVIWKEKSYNYDWLHQNVNKWNDVIEKNQIKPGSIVIIEADFSPNSIALFLSLIENRCILVPLTSSVADKRSEFIEIAQGEIAILIDSEDDFKIERLENNVDHQFYQNLRDLQHPGLVLFSSGSTGKSKASVHDFVPLLNKFKVPRNSWRTITFLLYDHIGGVNTMLYTLSNAGCIITVQDRNPESILTCIQDFKVQLLPTSPTFLNLLLISELYRSYDLSSLKVITYGTEPMPESTLKRLHALLPHIKLVQTYGLSEVGILRAKSENSDSLWVKVGGEGFDIKIVDDILWIKAKSAMLGYLNAPSPFDEEGWFCTGDLVEQRGEYLKILGRKSEIINVGGEKVYPVEVEDVIYSMEGIQDVMVTGESNPIMGQMVTAYVKLNTGEDLAGFRKRMHEVCKTKLARFKIPQKVILVSDDLHSQRFKKMRAGDHKS